MKSKCEAATALTDRDLARDALGLVSRLEARAAKLTALAEADADAEKLKELAIVRDLLRSFRQAWRGRL